MNFGQHIDLVYGGTPEQRERSINALFDHYTKAGVDSPREAFHKAVEQLIYRNTDREHAQNYRFLRNPKRSHETVGGVKDNRGVVETLYEYSLDNVLKQARINAGDQGMSASSLGQPVDYDWQHVRTQGLYKEIGKAKLQTVFPMADMDEVVVYQGEDGKLWARHAVEFHDGRFEAVSVKAKTPPAPPADPLDTPLPCDVVVGPVRHLAGKATVRHLADQANSLYKSVVSKKPQPLVFKNIEALRERVAGILESERQKAMQQASDLSERYMPAYMQINADLRELGERIMAGYSLDLGRPGITSEGPDPLLHSANVGIPNSEPLVQIAEPGAKEKVCVKAIRARLGELKLELQHQDIWGFDFAFNATSESAVELAAGILKAVGSVAIPGKPIEFKGGPISREGTFDKSVTMTKETAAGLLAVSEELELRGVQVRDLFVFIGKDDSTDVEQVAKSATRMAQAYLDGNFEKIDPLTLD